jgi:hypothetical protein
MVRHRKMRVDPTMGPDWVSEWVLIWAGTIALARAVGHALLKDAKGDARVKKAQDAWWHTLKTTEPKPSNFRDFIRRDRNLLLKEAELTVDASARVFGVFASIPPMHRNRRCRRSCRQPTTIK